METEETQQQEQTAVSFVTKKVLVTFKQHIVFPVDGMPITTLAAICEFEETVDGRRGSYQSFPRELRVVGFADRKLAKSLHLTIDVMGIAAMVRMED